MNPEHLAPFIAETINTFDVMLGVKLEEKELAEKSSTDGTYDISASIGISGAGTGAVVVSFPEAVATKVVSAMVGEELTGMTQEVADGIGELINIITGNAKRGLVKHGFDDISLSLPNVVVGKHRTIWRSKDMPCLMKSFFSSEFGNFCIEVNIRRNSA